jgi:hypothetical protein
MRLTIEINDDHLPPGTNHERLKAVAGREMRLIASALVRRAWVEAARMKEKT